MTGAKTYIFTALAISAAFALTAKTYKHDFGIIKEDGGEVNHVFVLDAAKDDYSIVHAVPGCACIKADFPRSVIKKGEKARVTLHYDPTRQHTHFTKSVYIKRSNGLRDTLQVSGSVKMVRELVDKKKYPADFGHGLRLATNGIMCGTIRPGSEKQVKTAMLNAFEVGMNVDFRISGRDAAMVKVPCGYILKPLSEGTLVVTVKVPNNFKGKTIDASLQPIVNGSEVNPIPISVKL